MMRGGPIGWSLMLLAFAAPAAAEEHDTADSSDIGTRLRACAACHGEEGRSGDETYAPSIAGKPSGYLHQQLLNFRDGRRQHRAMQQMLAYLSDDYLGEIAAYYGEREPALVARGGAATSAALDLGRKLVEEGDAARDLPACRSCHGPQLLGAQPSIPGLLALPADYLTAQLGAWRAGSRKAAPPDCMAKIAERLSREEAAAAAAWVASQPVPEEHRPAAALPEKPPLPCGGVQ